VVITSDEGRRGGRSIATKPIVDAALKECPLELGTKSPGRLIIWWHEEALKVPNYCPLFILYVSVPPPSLFLVP
jgi:acetyl-CoA synthetase